MKTCHDNGIVHRDLKPQNLLIDTRLNLRIADFAFAAPLKGRARNGSKGYLETDLGTRGYMAPEMFTGGGYKGEQIDVFAAGVSLFMILTGNCPFGAATQNDMYYRLLVKTPEDFWAEH